MHQEFIIFFLTKKSNLTLYFIYKSQGCYLIISLIAILM